MRLGPFALRFAHSVAVLWFGRIEVRDPVLRFRASHPEGARPRFRVYLLIAFWTAAYASTSPYPLSAFGSAGPVGPQPTSGPS